MENENKIQVFEKEEFGKVRTLMIDGEPWAVGKDVAEALGYKNPSNAVAAHVDPEDKTTYQIQVCDTDSTYPKQVCRSNLKTDITLINESGLYSLILSSKLPKAKEFKRWITSEVLPALRKTGHYGTAQKPTPTDPAKLAELVDTVAGLARAQRKNPREVAYCAAVVMHQYGVDLPGEFLTSQIHGEHILAQELEAEWNRVRNYKPILPWNE
jgi:prophage antirepressor-like protein